MFQEFDLAALPTPYYAVDLRLLKENLKVLAALQAQTGCKILLAQKAFSMFSLYPLLSEYLAGATASGYFEARLAHEHFSGENHVFSPAFTPEEFSLCAPICDHVVFNSKAQLERFLPVAREHRCSVGLRLNPECSTQDLSLIHILQNYLFKTDIYELPPKTRLEITNSLRREMIEIFSGQNVY